MMRSHSSLHVLIATGVLGNYIVWVGCGLHDPHSGAYLHRQSKHTTTP